MRRVAALVLVVAAIALPVRAEDWPDSACRVPVTALTHPERLVHTRHKLAAGQPLTIVAFGSSSTQGTGASTPAMAYPAQLEILLRHRAGLDVRVVNQGIGGEDVEQMRLRLGRDVIAAKPDLVIWQVGSNAAMRAMESSHFTALLIHEVDRLRAAGIDVVLMEPQQAPRVDTQPGAVVIISIVRAVAAQARVSLMPRHRVMEAWTASPSFSGPAIGPDSLHMTDLGYHCLALLLAEGVTGRPLP